MPTNDSKLRIINKGENENSKTLGLNCLPTRAELTYTIGKENSVKKITKRHILSYVGQIFDPLGFLSPCLIGAKILMHDLWLEWTINYRKISIAWNRIKLAPSNFKQSTLSQTCGMQSTHQI